MESQKNIFLFAFIINKFEEEEEERKKGGCNSFDHRDDFVKDDCWKILTSFLL